MLCIYPVTGSRSHKSLTKYSLKGASVASSWSYDLYFLKDDDLCRAKLKCLNDNLEDTIEVL